MVLRTMGALARQPVDVVRARLEVGGVKHTMQYVSHNLHQVFLKSERIRI